MVVCNVDRYLAEAIESVLNQSSRDFEFIILDFGSTDNSKLIASSYAAKDGRIRLHTIPHCGLAEARNAVCMLTRGRYLAIQDADDISFSDRLSLQVEFMEKHPEVDVVGGTTEWVDLHANPLRMHNVPTEDCEIKEALLTRNPFIHSSVLMRREAFLRVGGYRAAFAQAEDYDLWLRMSEHSQCANLKQTVVKYRLHPYQISLRKLRQQSHCALAAQASALARKIGQRDPLDDVKEITPAVLAGLGVTEAKQQAALFSGYHDWIYNMFIAKQYSVALNVAVEVAQSDWESIERAKIADLHVMIARLYWKQKKRFRGFLVAFQALLVQPRVVGSLFESFLRRFGLA